MMVYISECWIFTISDKPCIFIHNSKCKQRNGEEDFNHDDPSREEQEVPVPYFLLNFEKNVNYNGCCLGGHLYLFVWIHSKENVGYSHCLDKGHYKADVISNAQKCSCHLNERPYETIRLDLW